MREIFDTLGPTYYCFAYQMTCKSCTVFHEKLDTMKSSVLSQRDMKSKRRIDGNSSPALAHNGNFVQMLDWLVHYNIFAECGHCNWFCCSQ